MGSIPEWQLKIKNGLENSLSEWGVGIIVVLVGFSAFGLGRLSALEVVEKPVSVTEMPMQAVSTDMPLGGEFIAARTGSVYYYPWCSGAAKIKPENQRWFLSESAAQKAGYKPAKGCKGLGASDSAVE